MAVVCSVGGFWRGGSGSLSARETTIMAITARMARTPCGYEVSLAESDHIWPDTTFARLAIPEMRHALSKGILAVVCPDGRFCAWWQASLSARDHRVCGRTRCHRRLPKIRHNGQLGHPGMPDLPNPRRTKEVRAIMARFLHRCPVQPNVNNSNNPRRTKEV